MDSNDIPAAGRLETCRRVICDTYIGFDCAFADEDFRSFIDGDDVGSRTVTRVTFATLAENGEMRPQSSPPRAATLLRIKSNVKTHLRYEDLNVEVVRRSHGISTR